MSMKRILIADDEPHVIRVMKRSLERVGWIVDEVANGAKAIEHLEMQAPDVLITDIDMPRVTGQELCAWIQERLPGRSFPIVVLTSRAEVEHRQWASAIDNLMFMEKPVSMRALVSVIDNYFSEQNKSEQSKSEQNGNMA